MDDLTGSDASGNGHTGTISGGPTTVTAIISNGLQWSGVVTEAMAFPAVATSSSTFTVTMWINTTTTGQNYETLMDDPTGGYGIYIHSSKIDVYSGSGGDNLSSAGISINTWYFVAVVVSSGSGGIYINGASAGTFTFNHSPAFSLLASQNPGSRYFGSMDDVRIYNRALTAGEVTELFNWGGQP